MPDWSDPTKSTPLEDIRKAVQKLVDRAITARCERLESEARYFIMAGYHPDELVRVVQLGTFEDHIVPKSAIETELVEATMRTIIGRFDATAPDGTVVTILNYQPFERRVDTRTMMDNVWVPSPIRELETDGGIPVRALGEGRFEVFYTLGKTIVVAASTDPNVPEPLR